MTQFIKTMSKQAKIRILKTIKIIDAYYFDEEGEQIETEVKLAKGQEIAVELWQENNDMYMIMIDEGDSPICWIMKKYMTIVK